MRRRNSGEKPADRTWLVQKVMASSTVFCHGKIAAPCSTAAGAGSSRPAMRCSVASSSAASNWASNASHKTSENSAEASAVSGVPGSSFWRKRSKNSLRKALREENPKSASSVVASSVSISACHHACRRCCVCARTCTASSSRLTRASDAATERQSPRSHWNRAISHRWRCTSSACGSRVSSSSGRSCGGLIQPDFNAVCACRRSGSARRARTSGCRYRTSRHLRPRKRSCRAWCQWQCAGACHWCTRTTRPD